ncbi:hypothetical protein [Streptococcus ruminantium]|uniref:hypothetical protein n=1 Tax=Streptococcus ruminantium TaxID=1917441 RepID=UPI0012DCF57C|nr:hypothetical protein [Streptococcus ruminantium]
MKKHLKSILEQLRSIRLQNYGVVGYQKRSQDIMLQDIPIELFELWYNPNIESFRNLSKNSKVSISEIDIYELSRLILNEVYLLTRLEIIFSSLLNTNRKEDC